jgi:hypothetical protein
MRKKNTVFSKTEVVECEGKYSRNEALVFMEDEKWTSHPSKAVL